MKAGNYKAASGDKVLIDHGFMLIRWIGVKLHGSRGKKKQFKNYHKSVTVFQVLGIYEERTL